MLLAAELQRRHVPVHLIDAHPEALHWDRATVILPRSLEVFESLGLIDRFLEAGCKQRWTYIYADGRLLGTKDVSKCGSFYGYNLGLSEEVTESILTDYLQEQGGRIHRSSKLVGLVKKPDGVTAEIDRDGERYRIEAQWLVGCDGYHSSTRELGGIALEGHAIDQPWAVFDAAIDSWTETYEANFLYLDANSVILTGLPSRRWRVYLRPRSPEVDLVAQATEVLHRYAPETSFVEVESLARFLCHTKVATAFRSGPVLLAGDAAHVYSPNQGHGMNCGLQDAYNLAWKLALVHHGAATTTLLDSYEAERRPVAELIAASGDELESVSALTDPAERAERNQAIAARLADPDTQLPDTLASAELNIDYGQSPIVTGDPADRLGPGQRLPDCVAIQQPDGRPGRLHELTHRAGHTLLLLGGPHADHRALATLQAGLQEWVDTSPLFEASFTFCSTPPSSDPLGILAPASVEVLDVRGITLLAMRPDRHLGLRADEDHLHALEHYANLLQAGKPESPDG